jgi:hypothetical protein
MNIFKKTDLKLVSESLESIIDVIEKNKQQFNDSDKEIISDNDSISSAEQVKAVQQVLDKPKLTDVQDIVNLVLEFVKINKLIVYGGYAQNKIITHRSPKDAFYDESDAPDIDVYSPYPIKHLVEICDILHSKGYTDTIGKQAIHGETYKVFVKGYNALDLSYVPKNIFFSIPLIIINEVRYIDGSFALIDLFRMITEPLFSSWRWQKTFPRIYLIQKHYPLKKINKALKDPYLHKKNVDEPLKIVFENLKNNPNVYLFGQFAYNAFVNESTQTDIKQMPISYYSVVSIDYVTDVKNIVAALQFKNFNVKLEEYYPFFNFTGFSVVIKVNGEIVAHVYKHMKRCTPIKTIKDKNDSIQIGSFDFVLLFEMISAFRARVTHDRNKKEYHDTIISHLIELRNNYFEQNKKTLLDHTLFQSFIPDCTGPFEDTMKLAKEKRKENKKKGKLPMFIYKPVHTLSTEWIFANSSGNLVNRDYNKKIKL